MDLIFRKLKYIGHSIISILNAPEEFQKHVEAMKDVATIHTEIFDGPIKFLLNFVVSKKDIEKGAKMISKIPERDYILWFAYPKKSAKKYKSDISRDDGWQVLGDLGYEGVRMIAIDENWSALRMRKVEYIKTMKRDPKRAISKTGSSKSKGA